MKSQPHNASVDEVLKEWKLAIKIANDTRPKFKESLIEFLDENMPEEINNFEFYGMMVGVIFECGVALNVVNSAISSTIWEELLIQALRTAIHGSQRSVDESDGNAEGYLQ